MLLYTDATSGISGDMTVAALLDLGADREVLKEALDSLPLEGFSVQISRVRKAGLDCCDFAVLLDAAHENHDHDMEWLHGHAHEHAHAHTDGGHSHEHAHTHEAGEHGHEHRTLADVRGILRQARLTDGARCLAERIFSILADAEAEAHGIPAEEVHFHEVGAVDSIVDITAAAVCLDQLHVTGVIIPSLCEGSGTVRAQHGILPIPVPAVAAVCRQHGLPLSIVPDRGEFVTPTGAAIAAAVRTGGTLPERFRIVRTGMGAGKREYTRPGILRLFQIEEEGGTGETSVWKLESDVDDCSPEVLGYVMDRLYAAGAREVHFLPSFMKKNRPGWQVQVICMEEERRQLEEILFTETTTIGIRRARMERTVLEREIRTVETEFGPVRCKACRTADGQRCYPEYESAAAAAAAHGVPLMRVYRAAQEAGGKERS